MSLPLPARPSDATTIPRRSRKTRWITLAVLLTMGAGALGGWFRATNASEPPTLPQAAPTDTAARAPTGARIKVRVLNTTTTSGLAKRVALVLRDFGYDVVDFDSDRRTPRGSTLILSHTGHEDWARRLRRALGTGSVEQRADSLRYVDFTVFVGSDWKAPAQPFRP